MRFILMNTRTPTRAVIEEYTKRYGPPDTLANGTDTVWHFGSGKWVGFAYEPGTMLVVSPGVLTDEQYGESIRYTVIVFKK